MGIKIDLSDLSPTVPLFLHETGRAVQIRPGPDTPRPKKGPLDDQIGRAELRSLVKQLAGADVLDVSADQMVALEALIGLTQMMLDEAQYDLDRLERRLRKQLRRPA
jgi:hypothetical protein